MKYIPAHCLCYVSERLGFPFFKGIKSFQFLAQSKGVKPDYASGGRVGAGVLSYGGGLA